MVLSQSVWLNGIPDLHSVPLSLHFYYIDTDCSRAEYNARCSITQVFLLVAFGHQWLKICKLLSVGCSSLCIVQ